MGQKGNPRRYTAAGDTGPRFSLVQLLRGEYPKPVVHCATRNQSGLLVAGTIRQPYSSLDHETGQGETTAVLCIHRNERASLRCSARALASSAHHRVDRASTTHAQLQHAGRSVSLFLRRCTPNLAHSFPIRRLRLKTTIHCCPLLHLSTTR